MSSYSTESAPSKKNYTGTVVASFVGVLAAVPISMAMFSPDNRVGAVSGGDPVDNYAQYAHAYTQGFMANSGPGSAATLTEGSTCTDTHAKAETHGGSSATLNSTPEAAAGGYGAAALDWGDKEEKPSTEHLVSNIKNSYNTYKNNVNHHTTHNVNSNNTVGSHNSTSTQVDVTDSLGVVVGVDNGTSATNTSSNHSNNSDSYNSTVNNNSHNTTTDSHNNTEVNVNSGNTTTEETNTTINSNSHNTTNTDVDVDVDTNINTDIDVTDNSNQDNSQTHTGIEVKDAIII